MLIVCVQTRGVDSRERVQGVHFYGVHSVYQISKAIQETSDLDDRFASGLSAQALESDNLGLNTLNCCVTLGRLLTSLILTHKVEIVITVM